ncbi:MAG: hypothetical protein OIF57_05725 [Marinobacterium sp.]|nr:hypothetical protein [Marinobacterium sp.]
MNAINSGLLVTSPHSVHQPLIEYRYIRSFLILQQHAAQQFYNIEEIKAFYDPQITVAEVEQMFLNSGYLQTLPRAEKAPTLKNVVPLSEDIPRPRETFTSFQAACTLLDIDPDKLKAAMEGYAYVLYDFFPGHFEAIQVLNDELVVKILSGELEAQQEGTGYSISYAALRSYAIRQGIVPYLLFNEMEVTLRNAPVRSTTGFELAGQHFLHSEPLPANSPEEATSTPEGEAMPDTTAHEDPQLQDDLAELALLLKGDHEYQAPELRICIEAWLAVMRKAKSMPEGKLKRSINLEVSNWVRKHYPENVYPQISGSESASGLKGRIPKVCNWDK